MANHQLLLIQDVEDLGRSGDLVSVKPGFSRNFLLPQKLAVVADARAIKMQARLKEERQKKALIDKEDAEKTAAALVDVTVSKAVKVDHDGHMYGSVTAADIVHLVQEQTGVALEKRSIQLKTHIKEVGVFEVAIKLKEGVAAAITVKITPEEAQHS